MNELPRDELTVTPERWLVLEPLVDALLDLAESDRHAFVERITATTPQLGADLERLWHDPAGASLLDRAEAARSALLSGDGASVQDSIDERRALQASLGSAYSLERELTGGGMSRVFVASETGLGRRIVIKVFSSASSASIDGSRFEREIRTIASLQQANIVPLLTAGRANGLPYYTMPFVEGSSLRERIARDGPLPIRDVVGILRDVARGLAYAHEHGIVHRDIKPGNILLSGAAAVVTDFGIARALSAARARDESTEITHARVSIGTPMYMAPEQILGDAPLDHRADLYALGVVGYEMLTGSPPFAGRSMQQLLAAHAAEMPISIESERASVPPALTAVIARCLAKSPADRPRSAGELLEALEDIATTTLSSAASTPSRSRRRPRGVVVPAAVLAVLLISVIGGVVLQRPHRSGLNPRRIVVAPFQNLTGDSTLNWLGPLTAEGITQGLDQLDSIDVVSSYSGLTDARGRVRHMAGRAALRTVGEETRAGRVVWGSYSRHGDSLELRAEIVFAPDGRVERTFDPVDGLVSAPAEAIERLRDRVAAAIELSSTKATVGTMGHLPSLAAYRLYLNALPSLGGEGSLSNLTRATQLDTTFTLAFVWLANTYANFDNFRAADSIIRIFDARRDQLPPVEQELLEEADAYAHQQYERDLRAAHQLFRRDSTTTNAFGVAFDAGAVNRPREALNIWNWLVAAGRVLSPSARVYQTIALHAVGDYKAELATAATARSSMASTRSIQARKLLLSEFRALAALGSSRRLSELADSVVATWVPGSSPTPGDVFELISTELEAHGSNAEAEAYIRRGLEWNARRVANHPESDSVSSALAHLLSLAGSFDSARTIWQRMAARDTLFVGARVELAILAAHTGDAVTALSTMHTLDSLSKLRFAYGRPLLCEARIAAALGRRDDAVRLIESAMLAGVPFDMRWHSAADFRSLQDYEPFRGLIRPKG